MNNPVFEYFQDLEFREKTFHDFQGCMRTLFDADGWKADKEHITVLKLKFNKIQSRPYR